MKKIVLRAFLATLVLFGALVLYGYLSWCAPVYEETARVRETALPARFRNWDEHDRIVAATHPQPYVVEFSSGDGALIFYGAHHTSSPNDSQHTDIEARWRAFVLPWHCMKGAATDTSTVRSSSDWKERVSQPRCISWRDATT